MNGLNLHAGGELVTFDQLVATPTPAATATHVPIAHSQLVLLVRSTLAMFGHEVVEEHHALDKDGQRYFGVMTLRSNHQLFTDSVGLRNSGDKSFPIGIAFGSVTFVCSNLAFVGDHVIRRRHTANAKRELPGLLMEIIEPLSIAREAQAKKLLTYQETHLDASTADHLVMELYRQGVVNLQRIPEVLAQYENPKHQEWGKETLWTLFNSVTYALNGRVMENPQATPTLHKVLDDVAYRAAA